MAALKRADLAPLFNQVVNVSAASDLRDNYDLFHPLLTFCRIFTSRI